MNEFLEAQVYEAERKIRNLNQLTGRKFGSLNHLLN